MIEYEEDLFEEEEEIEEEEDEDDYTPAPGYIGIDDVGLPLYHIGAGYVSNSRW